MTANTETTTRPARRARRFGRAAAILSLALVGGGSLALAIGEAVAPDAVEQLYGDAVVTVYEAGQAITGTPATVTLGLTGERSLLDRCDGTFSRIISYEAAGTMQPTWAAHNGCSGDAILPLEVGDTLVIAGGDAPGLYEVVDSRKTGKAWTTIGEIEGMRGTFLLQTCLYGRPYMLFLGVERIGDAMAR